MDLDPGNLLVSLLVSGAGFVAFSYGRKQRRMPQMAIGVVLMVFPYFVADILLMMAIAAALLALLWWLVRRGL